MYVFIHLSIYLVCHYVTSRLHDSEQCNPICSQSTVLSRIKCKASLPLFATCWHRSKNPMICLAEFEALEGTSMSLESGWSCTGWQLSELHRDGWRPVCTCKTLNRVMIFKSTSLLLLQRPQWLVVLGLVVDHQKICPDYFRLRSETGMRESMVQTRAGARAWQECIESAQAAWAQSSWQEFS